jgi:hypothetical protein
MTHGRLTLKRPRPQGESQVNAIGGADARPATVLRAIAALIAAAALALVVPAPGASQQPGGVVQCRQCHSNREFLRGKAKTLKADSALYVTDSLLHDSKHAGLACASCHPAFTTGYPHRQTTVAAVACQSCHAKQGDDWARSIHAGDAVTKGNAPTCATCHGTHQVLGAADPRSPTYPLNAARLCANCHANPDIIGMYFNTPGQAQAQTAVKQYYQTVHGNAMTRAGLVVSATCDNCHGSHLILPPDSAQSTINRANVARTCGACHAGVLRSFDSSSHGQAGRTGKKTSTGHSAPVCVDCHPAHEVVRASDPKWFRGVVRVCGSCHEQEYTTYFETYHGQVTELGFGLTAKCSDCHTAHAMLPVTDTASSVHPTNLIKTCGACHPKANANFIQYDPHSDARNRRGLPILFWTWLFMTTLLASVFLFFGPHTLLWLGRLTLDRIRRRSVPASATAAPPPPAPDGERNPPESKP